MVFLEAIKFSEGLKETEAARLNNLDNIFKSIREGAYEYKSVEPTLIILISYFLAARHGVYFCAEDFYFIFDQVKKLTPKIKIRDVNEGVLIAGHRVDSIKALLDALWVDGRAFYFDSGQFKLGPRGLDLSGRIVGDFFTKEPIVFMELSKIIWQVIYPKFFKAPIV